MMETTRMDGTTMHPPGMLKRIVTLALVVAVYVAAASWFFFQEERKSILRTVETTLAAEARATASRIAVWYAPVRQQGMVFASSNVAQLYTAGTPTAAATPEDAQRIKERHKSQQQAMGVYLKRLIDRLDASQAVLFDQTGTLLAASTVEDSGLPDASTAAQLDMPAIVKTLPNGETFTMPVRMSESGPFLDVVFPVYSNDTVQSENPTLVGGFALSFSLFDLLSDWLAATHEAQRHTQLLEQNGSTISAITSSAITPLAWRNGQVLPGLYQTEKTRAVQSAEPASRRGTKDVLAGIASYSVPAQGNKPEHHVLAVAAHVPLLASWFVVREVSAEETQAAIDSLRQQTVLGGLAAGAVLFFLLFLRWWWLDGRLQRKMRSSMHTTQNELYKSRQIIAAFGASLAEGVCLTGTDGIFEYVNKSFAAMVGIPPEHLAGKTVHDVFDSIKANQHADRDTQVVHSGEAQSFDDTWNSAVESIATRYRIYKYPVHDAYHRVSGVVTIIRAKDSKG